MTIPPSKVRNFCISIARHDRGRQLNLHQLRDAQATLSVFSALAARGFAYGGPIFNSPPVQPMPGRFAQPLHPISMSGFRPGDVILVNTRLPAHDDEDASMKRIERGWTTLEQQLIDFLVPNFFEHLSRERVTIGLKQVDHLALDFKNFRSMELMQRGNLGPIVRAYGQRHDKRARRKRLSPVFHLYQPELFQGGPAVLMAFGMTGLTTQIWAHRLAGDHAHLLLRPGFHVYGLELGKVPPRAEDMEFSCSWGLVPMLDHSFGPGGHLPWMLKLA